MRYYTRSPPDSDKIFKLSSQGENENVEGLLARNVPVMAPTVRRSARLRPWILLCDIEKAERFAISGCYLNDSGPSPNAFPQS